MKTYAAAGYLLLLVAAPVRWPAKADEQRFPSHPLVVDVTKPPYSAKGDGVSDDSDALQNALNENVGRHKMLYFPKGTYLISRTLTWPKKWNGKDNWGQTMLRGESRDGSVLRLKDGMFADAKKPAALMWCGGFGSADWFHNYVENLTFDVGADNAAAVALQFYSNNTGAVRDCRFVAAEGSGAVGLDLGHRDMNGPLLVSNCEVIGFARGITTARAVNSQTFENITLRGQRQAGFTNEGQPISIRGLTSNNAVPAVSTYGKLLLTDAKLTGGDGAKNHPAIVSYNGGRIFVRDVKTTGYKRALADLKAPDFAAAYRLIGEDKPGTLGPDVAEYSSHDVTTAFPSPARSLRLPVKETPLPVWEPADQWAVVDAFGADPSGKEDSADAIQKAMDSGATTVFLPGHYTASRTIEVRGKVRRVLGISGWMNYGKRDLINLRIGDARSRSCGWSISADWVAARRSTPSAQSSCAAWRHTPFVARREARVARSFLRTWSATTFASANSASGPANSTSRTKARTSPTMAATCGCSATRPNAAARWSIRSAADARKSSADSATRRQRESSRECS
jgi:hypothetical protein